jgi:hypothetical protein
MYTESFLYLYEFALQRIATISKRRRLTIIYGSFENIHKNNIAEPARWHNLHGEKKRRPSSLSIAVASTRRLLYLRRPKKRD